MSQINDQMLTKAREHVSAFLREHLSDKITFHTLDHTCYVVEKTILIGKNSGLTAHELRIAECCAWFHDIGYAINPDRHEEIGAANAEEFLIAEHVDAETIDRVKACILSTRMPQQPQDMISKVLCDADLAHLAEDDYFERIEKMRKEWAKLSDGKFSRKKFYLVSNKFFKNHEYHTDFAKKQLKPRKDQNLERINEKLYMLEKKSESEILEGTAKKKKKDKGYSRGVESMFRLTARNQINLSSIADNKSNILISVNAIIMSITMTVLVTRFEEMPNIILPTLIFLIFCLITIVFAILSTRPQISSGTFTKEDIKKNRINLLFFGNFYNMKLDEYEWAVGQLMKNDENLYATMIKDQYSLGLVLAKKYKLLRIAYNVFMVGIIISVLSFVLAFVNI